MGVGGRTTRENKLLRKMKSSNENQHVSVGEILPKVKLNRREFH